MRKPTQVERLYLDFDGFFAAVEQAANRRLQGRPVGVVPFPEAVETDRGILIACSREAKMAGVKSVMAIAEARQVCPDLVLVAQSPDLYRRAHNTLIAEIMTILPIDAVKSIDELTCKLSPREQLQPFAVAQRIKARLALTIGPALTCSIGIAANRLLAKMACKAGKRPEPHLYGDGCLIWPPQDMPKPLLPLTLNDIPGVGSRMAVKLYSLGIGSMAALLATEPKQLRKIWGNVTGERLWYALHGYDIQASPQARGMYGHGRVLPPDHRSFRQAREASRLLMIKAARRLRRDHWRAGRVWLYLSLRGSSWQNTQPVGDVQDDQAVLAALEALWQRVFRELEQQIVFRVHVALFELSPDHMRQLDLFTPDDGLRQRWESATTAVDLLNSRYGRTLVSLGPWVPPPGGYAGGKISYTRIPQAEDFL